MKFNIAHIFFSMKLHPLLFFLCIFCNAPAMEMLEKYYPGQGLPEYKEFFYDVLKDSIEHHSFDNMHELIVEQRVPFYHEELREYDILQKALEKGHYTLASVIITSHIDLKHSDYSLLLHEALFECQKDPQVLYTAPYLYTLICPKLIHHGIPLNIKVTTPKIVETSTGPQEISVYNSTLKLALRSLINAQNDDEKKLFEGLFIMMLQHGAIPNYDCQPAKFNLRAVSEKTVNALWTAYTFYTKNRDNTKLITEAQDAGLLGFLITLAFTNNGNEITCNACELLWDIEDFLSKKKRSGLVALHYQPDNACNEKYRNGYNSFKKMYTLFTMYTKRNMTDVCFSYC